MKAMVDSKLSWLIAGACFLISFCTDGVFRSQSIYFDSILTTFDISRNDASWPFVLSGVMYSLGVSVSGVLNKMINIRNQMVMCVIGSSLGMGLNFFARHITMITIFYGFGFGLFTGQLYGVRSYMVAKVFDKYRIMAMGIMNAGSSVGTFAFPHVLIKLIEEYRVSGCFLIMSGVTLQALIGTVICILVFRHMVEKETPKDKNVAIKDIELQNFPLSNEEQPKEVTGLNKFLNVLSIMKEPMFYIVTLSYVVFFFAFVPFLTVLFEYGKDKGLSTNEASFLPSVYATLDLVGRIAIGIIMDTSSIKRRNAQMVIFMMSGLIYFLITLFKSNIITNVLIAFSGLLSGAILTMEFPTFTQYFGVKKLPDAIALSNLPMALLQLAVPKLIGYYRDYLKSYNFLLYTFAGLHGLAGFLWIFEPWAAKKSKDKASNSCELEVTKF